MNEELPVLQCHIQWKKAFNFLYFTNKSMDKMFNIHVFISLLNKVLLFPVSEYKMTIENVEGTDIKAPT